MGPARMGDVSADKIRIEETGHEMEDYAGKDGTGIKGMGDEVEDYAGKRWDWNQKSVNVVFCAKMIIFPLKKT